ncbi:PREDICTED: interleukin-22 receptor subunit alpha-1 isoform X3 [Gavialis gangeticus]|uniref:interleukin-22 receptor subunit alpha-1 isoform X3 n=1 Tax=Gavialis gangeticus TaxID=94835 RepID=UPI00092F4006|nr:PREDICTED: interleukin-22 receptor subunit alpha-1 isoform X3 [Gavialis gangeticus]
MPGTAFETRVKAGSPWVVAWILHFSNSSFVPLGCLTAERLPLLLLKNAEFFSTNFENILKWETEGEIPPGTVYNVQYKEYVEKKWLNKTECQNISQRFCNLTHETENFTEYYYARVQAMAPNGYSSDWVCSQRFKPKQHTNIGAPEVKYIPNVRSIKFLIQPPYTPLKDEDDHQLNVEDIYSTVEYHMTIFSQSTQQEWTKTEYNKEFEVSHLEPDTGYNGTIYIQHLQKKSKAQVFEARTLPDNTWLLFCFGSLIFTAGLLFAATCYVMYIYVKQRTAHPKSLDFKGILPFQPLSVTVEHISCKPALLTSNVPLPSISQCLEQPHSFGSPETTYQQQAKMSASQPIAQLPDWAGDFPSKRVTEDNLPCKTKNKPLALTYGVCLEDTNQTVKDVSPERFVCGKFILQTPSRTSSKETYREKSPELVEKTLWESNDIRGPAFLLGSTGQAQQLQFQMNREEAELYAPQLPLSLLEGGGGYRQQTVELLPLLSSMTMDTNSVPETGSLVPLPSPFPLSVGTCDDLPGEDSTPRKMLLDSLSHSEDKLPPPDFQTTYVLRTAKQSGGTDLSSTVTQASGSAQDSDMSLTMFFRDLDLKLQWECALDENTLVY